MSAVSPAVESGLPTVAALGPWPELRPYDPTTVCPDSKQFFSVVKTSDARNPAGQPYVLVRMTAVGHRALAAMLTNDTQRAVYMFPVCPFWLAQDSISVDQLRSSPCRLVDALLIASRGPFAMDPCTHDTGAVFRDSFHLPGYWGACCAGCRLAGADRSCSALNYSLGKYQPRACRQAALRLSILQELEG